MYHYETHLHTKEASACAGTAACEYPAFYKSQGFDGIFVTDHFFNGNTAIPRYPNDWERMVNEFCMGYEHAKAAGDAIGFPVFFGWESNYQGDEYLIYGLDKEWLFNHPDILTCSRNEQYEMVRRDGGLVVQAHPFRERSYLNTIRLNPNTCDAMEAYNSGNPTIQNRNAEIYCREHNIFMTAGSDNHLAGSFTGTQLYGMAFEEPLTCAGDYVRNILNRDGHMWVPDSELLPSDYKEHPDIYKISVSLPVFVQ